MKKAMDDAIATGLGITKDGIHITQDEFLATETSKLREALIDALPFVVAWAAAYQDSHHLKEMAPEHVAAIEQCNAALKGDSHD